jgi:bacteriocin-like protein
MVRPYFIAHVRTGCGPLMSEGDMNKDEQTKARKPVADQQAQTKPGKSRSIELNEEELEKVSGGAGPQEEEQLQG